MNSVCAWRQGQGVGKGRQVFMSAWLRSEALCADGPGFAARPWVAGKEVFVQVSCVCAVRCCAPALRTSLCGREGFG